MSKIFKQTKKWPWYAKVLIAVWAILVGTFVTISLWSVFQNGFSDAAGWAQVAVEVLGLPLVIYGLYRLAPEKPVIQIGVAFGHPRQVREEYNEFSNKVITGIWDNKAPFLLIVRNRGNVAAKFVKISLEINVREPTNWYGTILEHTGDFPFVAEGTSENLTLCGGEDLVIYPKDEVAFRFSLASSQEILEENNYNLRCMVWAEGLSEPKIEYLLVRASHKNDWHTAEERKQSSTSPQEPTVLTGW